MKFKISASLTSFQAEVPHGDVVDLNLDHFE